MRISKRNTMKILVTGGLGHIGSSLIRKLEFSKKPQLFVCDSFLTQRYSSMFDIPEDRNVRFFRMETQEITPKFLSTYEITAVIHLAAMTDAAGSF